MLGTSGHRDPPGSLRKTSQSSKIGSCRIWLILWQRGCSEAPAFCHGPLGRFSAASQASVVARRSRCLRWLRAAVPWELPCARGGSMRVLDCPDDSAGRQSHGAPCPDQAAPNKLCNAPGSSWSLIGNQERARASGLRQAAVVRVSQAILRLPAGLRPGPPPRTSSADRVLPWAPVSPGWPAHGPPAPVS